MGRNLIDLTGKQIGKWTVLKRVISDRSQTMWLCRCKCGVEKDIFSTHLVQENSKGCVQCSGKERLGPKSPSWTGCGKISGHFFDSITRSAGGKGKRRPLKFDVTIEYLWELFQKQNGKCALTGIDLDMNSPHDPHTASLDRIDGTKGYTEDNVQWVHKHINRMKSIFDEQYYIEMCRKVTEHDNHINAR